jgi:hypothetical protein
MKVSGNDPAFLSPAANCGSEVGRFRPSALLIQTRRCKDIEQMPGKDKKGKSKQKKEKMDEPVCQYAASDISTAD